MEKVLFGFLSLIYQNEWKYQTFSPSFSVSCWKLKGKKKKNYFFFSYIALTVLTRKTEFCGYWKCKINKIGFYRAEGINFVILRYETLGSVENSGIMGRLQAWQRDIHCFPNHTFVSSDLQYFAGGCLCSQLIWGGIFFFLFLKAQWTNSSPRTFLWGFSVPPSPFWSKSFHLSLLFSAVCFAFQHLC